MRMILISSSTNNPAKRNQCSDKAITNFSKKILIDSVNNDDEIAKINNNLRNKVEKLSKYVI